MRRLALPATVLVVLLTIALLVASALGRPEQAQQAGERVRVEQVDTGAYPEITLYVSALDEQGRPRTGLDADDFAVTEDGTPVEIAEFGGVGGEPVTSVLVIDRSGSMDEDDKIEGARDAAEAFVDLMRPGDRAALLAFNNRVELDQGFTSDQGELLDAINDLEPNDGTALYDAVVEGVALLRAEPGRRLLLVLSDGRDCSVPFDSCPDYAGSSHTLDEAIAYAEEAGQPIAVVGLGNRAGGGNEGIDETVLQQIATATGGRYFYAPQAADLAGLYAGLAADVQREYRLSYLSPRPFYDGTRRDIAVTVGGAAASVGYTERHLINVVSSPLAGIVLLVPLVGLLVLPRILRRRKAPTPAEPSAPAPAPQFAGPTLVPTTMAPGAPAVSNAVRHCRHCKASIRATARFCSRCGKEQ